MLPRPRGIPFSRIHRLGWLVAILLLLPINLLAEQTHSNVVCREDLSQARRDELANKLRRITGWPDLPFNLRIETMVNVGYRLLLKSLASG